MANLVLIGFKSSGKTKIGRYLSKILNRKFIDTDDLLKRKYKMSCFDLMKMHGEKNFRKKEMFILESIKAENVIIATGGGTVDLKANRELIKKMGKVVFLDLAKDKIIKRILRTNKSYLSIKGPVYIDKVFKRRRKFYLSIADETIALLEKSKEEIAKEIIKSEK